MALISVDDQPRAHSAADPRADSPTDPRNDSAADPRSDSPGDPRTDPDALADPDAAVFGTAAAAMAAVRAGLDYLAGLDAAALTADEQADCLRGLAAAESVQLSATCRVLSAFRASSGFAADGAISATGWLRWQTRITRPAAGATAKWARRLDAHPAIAGGLAAGRVSPSWARQLCDWSDALPEAARAAADEQLTAAALAGLELSDLAMLAEEIRIRTATPDTDGPDHFGQRRLRLTDYYRGNGHLDGDLTPQASAALQTILDSLGERTGPEDDRSKEQRDHDALEEACMRLIASKLLPQRAGQPVHLNLDIPLSQLLGQPDTDPAASAAATIAGTPAPPGADCDAAIIPIVTGTVDEHAAAQAAARLLAGRLGLAFAAAAAAASDAARYGSPAISPDLAAAIASLSSGEVGSSGLAWRAGRLEAIAHAAALLSGPGGLASFLRTAKLSGPAASPSLPLDVGTATDTIPAHLRRAIARRDRHCRFPGCDQPPSTCHVHHLRPRADGGETSLSNCCLLCRFHHLIVIHRRGWQLVLNADGTTTATSPGGRVLHSHAPPAAA